MGGDLWMHYNETQESREAREAYNIQNTGDKGPEESSTNKIEWDCSAGSVQIDLSDLIERQQQPTGSSEERRPSGTGSKKLSARKFTMGRGSSDGSTQLFNPRDLAAQKDKLPIAMRPGVPTLADGVPPLTAEVRFAGCSFTDTGAVFLASAIPSHCCSCVALHHCFLSMSALRRMLRHVPRARPNL